MKYYIYEEPGENDVYAQEVGEGSLEGGIVIKKIVKVAEQVNEVLFAGNYLLKGHRYDSM